MKEFGPQGFNPQEKLTAGGTKPYAGGGEFIMPESGEGAPKEAQEINNTPSDEIHPPKVEMTQLEWAKKQLSEQYEKTTGRPPISVDELKSIDMLAEQFVEKSHEAPRVEASHSQTEKPPYQAEQKRTPERGINEPISSGNFVTEGGDLRVEDPIPELKAKLDEWEREYTGPTDFSRNEAYTGRGETVLRPSATMKKFGGEEYRPISGGDHTKKEMLDEVAEEERKHWYMKKLDSDGNVMLDTNGDPIPETTKDKNGNEVIVPYPARWTRNRSFLPEEIKRNLQDSELYGLTINNVEALAVEIMDTDQTPEFQIGGEFQLLNEQGEFQPDNFLHWTRSWMMYWHNEDPLGKWEFGREIGLKRDYNSIPLQELLNRAGRYFRTGNESKVDDDGNKKVYRELVEQIKRETWLFNSSRTFNITYQENMGRDEDLAKTLNQLFFTNTFTKSVWGNRSALYWMANMPQHFQERDSNGGEKQDDGRIGESLTTAYLIYYNMSDEDELRRILGEDTDLLNQGKIKEALNRQMYDEHIPADLRDTYLSSDDLKQLEKGDIIGFINIFNQPQKSPRIVKLVRGIIEAELAKKYDLYMKNENGNSKTKTAWRDKLDKDGKAIIKPNTGEKEQEEYNVIDITSVGYADTFAWSMARWTGAGARNDTNSVGFDAWTKFQHTDTYRGKQVDPKRIGAYGNNYTVHQLKQLGLDLFNGVQSLNQLTPLEIFTMLHNNKDLDNKTDISKLSEKEQYEIYEKKSSQLVFADNTMRSFTVDHFNRIFAVFSQVMDSEAIDFDKFTKFDVISGLTFDRAQFDKAVKEGFFKPMRYAWSTYRGLDLTKEIRTLNPETKKYETVHIAEAMFGKEILDIPPLWKKGKEHIKITDSNWSEKIDWEKLKTTAYTYKNDKGKETNVEFGEVLWRRVALFRLGAEYWSHRDRHSNDHRYDPRYYEQIMMAIDTLPAYIAGDETSMKDAKAWGSAFTEEERKWLRSLSHTERWRLLMGGLGRGMATEGLKGLADAGNALLKGIAS